MKIKVKFDKIYSQDWNNEIIFAIGSVQIPSEIPKKNIFFISNPLFINPYNFFSTLALEIWKKNILILIPSDANQKESVAILNLQLHIISNIFKNSIFPSQTSAKIPNIFNNLMGQILDPSRSISQMRNIPWLLRYPLGDKLESKSIKKPCLILMPGPSLKKILPHLKNISKKCIIICISRSIKLCLNEGVQPDFLVQYDTNYGQARFLQKIPNLPNTVLFALSSAHIHPYASKFKGVIFRGSFKKMFLQNSFVARDGVEGSLIACLGLCELLQATHTYIAGADLCWDINSEMYASNVSSSIKPSDPIKIKSKYLEVDNGNLFLPCRDGMTVQSSPWYISTAIRAEKDVQEISAKTKGKFFTMDSHTLLSSKYFPVASLESINEHLEFDRNLFINDIENVLNTKETIKINFFFRYVDEYIKIIQSLLGHLYLSISNNENDDIIKSNPLVAVTPNIRGEGINLSFSTTAGLLLGHHWLEALNNAKIIIWAHSCCKCGKPIPILCSPDETTKMIEIMNRLFPDSMLEVWKIGLDIDINDNKKTVSAVNLFSWVNNIEKAFISPEVMKTYWLTLQTFSMDKLFNLAQVLPHF
jgi:hypothetical protein